MACFVPTKPAPFTHRKGVRVEFTVPFDKGEPLSMIHSMQEFLERPCHAGELPVGQIPPIHPAVGVLWRSANMNWLL